jgi:hypothetical protein
MQDDAEGWLVMPQPQLKQDYVVMTVSCGNCQQEQLVHVHVGTGTGQRLINQLSA